MLAKSDPFFFHENHRIPVCKKKQHNVFDRIDYPSNIDLAFIHDECGTDSTDFFTIWHFSLFTVRIEI